MLGELIQAKEVEVFISHFGPHDEGGRFRASIDDFCSTPFGEGKSPREAIGDMILRRHHGREKEVIVKVSWAVNDLTTSNYLDSLLNTL